MFTEEVRAMLAQVLTSWQVWAVTIVLVFYISLVNYVARLRRRTGKSSLIRRRKKSQKEKVASPPEIVSDDDDLGLEDTVKRKR
jgi:putative exporter of polyketide antibiotics